MKVLFYLSLQLDDELLTDDLEDEEDVFIGQPHPIKGGFGAVANKAAYVSISPNQSVSQSGSQSVSQSINQSVSKSVSQSVNQLPTVYSPQ